MKNTTLIIMAAGIGSRFGKRIKQLTPVGPNGEIIIDYSIYDALKAGFNKIVFVIRKDIEEEFREVIGNRIEQICDVKYIFQEIDDLPEGYSVPNGRTMPWGTGQAILACKDVVNEPFAIINADDYYGKESFVQIHNYLVANSEDKYNYCMAGFILKNTLSDNGGVTRGICHIDKENNLIDVEETKNIVKCQGGACIEGTDKKIDVESYVSMNMWGLTPEFFDILDTKFIEFLDGLKDGDIKSEYLIPIIIGELLNDKKVNVKLIETRDKWFGVTYAEDKETVKQAFCELIEKGVYTSPIYQDLLVNN